VHKKKREKIKPQTVHRNSIKEHASAVEKWEKQTQCWCSDGYLLFIPVFTCNRLRTWLELPILPASQADQVLWTSRSLPGPIRRYRQHARASVIQPVLHSRCVLSTLYTLQPVIVIFHCVVHLC